MVVCRFCKSPAAGRFKLDTGCFCYPDDREQDLCPQHIIRATPVGSFELLVKYYDSIVFYETV